MPHDATAEYWAVTLKRKVGSASMSTPLEVRMSVYSYTITNR